jgi:hypothetical protein
VSCLGPCSSIRRSRRRLCLVWPCRRSAPRIEGMARAVVWTA